MKCKTTLPTKTSEPIMEQNEIIRQVFGFTHSVERFSLINEVKECMDKWAEKENTQLKEQLSQLEQRNNALLEALQWIIEMKSYQKDEWTEMKAINAKAKEALNQNK